MEDQFSNLHRQLEVSRKVQEQIQAVALEIESVNRRIQSSLLLVHQSPSITEVVEKANAEVGRLKEAYSRLLEILHEYPGSYYRYHVHWRGETQTAVCVLAFVEWLEKGKLLLHGDAEEKLGLSGSEEGLDIEDYLMGICFMSSELPRYVVNRVTAVGDYVCPSATIKFFTSIHAAFRMLNLRNDNLRRKFDAMKYDLRKVEEIHYDVKIRGLIPPSNQ